MTYTRKDLEMMSIEKLKSVDNKLSKMVRNVEDEVMTETITINLNGGNNLVGFPYNLVNNNIMDIQNQNPQIHFNWITHGGTGLFDTDGDGFMEAGNLTSLQPDNGYFININGDSQLNLEIYSNSEDVPITYNLYIPIEVAGSPKLISYDGPDGAHTLDALGARGAFVEYITQPVPGVGLFNFCLSQWKENYQLNAPYDSLNDYGDGFNSDVAEYYYDEDTCWGGNLSNLYYGDGLWIDLFAPPGGQQFESGIGHSPPNIGDYYNAMGDLPPNYSTSFSNNFTNFQWLRSQSPKPKSVTVLSNNKVKEMIRKVDKTGELSGDINVNQVIERVTRGKP